VFLLKTLNENKIKLKKKNEIPSTSKSDLLLCAFHTPVVDASISHPLLLWK
jgi:hypothetical protein